MKIRQHSGPLYAGVKTLPQIALILKVSLSTLRHRVKRAEIKPDVRRKSGNVITSYFNKQTQEKIKKLFRKHPLWSNVGRPKGKK